LEDEITNRNLMPGYLVGVQFKEDSARAALWAAQSGDSTRWLKYQTPAFRNMMLDSSYGSKSPLYQALHKPSPYKSALAERLARQKAQAAAATIGLDSALRSGANSPGDSNRPRTPKPPRSDTGAKPAIRKPQPNLDSIKKIDSTPAR
jgi:hypothetical protein